MTTDVLAAHALLLLGQFKGSLEKMIEEGSMGVLPMDNLSVALDELIHLGEQIDDIVQQIGLTAAARKVVHDAQSIRDLILNHTFTEMVAQGADAEQLRSLFGDFPMPDPDPNRHAALQHDRQLVILGRIKRLSDLVEGIISSIERSSLPSGKEEPKTKRSSSTIAKKRGGQERTEERKRLHKRIVDAWNTGEHRTYAELSAFMGLKDEREVERAIDNWRKKRRES